MCSEGQVQRMVGTHRRASWLPKEASKVRLMVSLPADGKMRWERAKEGFPGEDQRELLMVGVLGVVTSGTEKARAQEGG